VSAGRAINLARLVRRDWARRQGHVATGRHGTHRCLLVEHGELELGDPFGVREEVESDDLAVPDRGGGDRERLPVEEGAAWATAAAKEAAVKTQELLERHADVGVEHKLMLRVVVR
jgi:hypothetical protein